MATIANLKLSIKKGNSKSDVTVSYDICFSHCEKLDETVFVEKVTLKGDDGILADDHLLTVANKCVKATKTCIPRKFVRKVNNSVLDEDDTFFNRTDEVYAKVDIKPFVPSKRSATSNIISSNF
ncbi:hypothetical protein [uncultured Algibacter sp.]|uniref:hypothetical protein n=1 Tax=uncultured Algibacter sp. TaxID=298659 RepID=UPI003216BB11